MAYKYERLTFKVAGGKRRTAWAVNVSVRPHAHGEGGLLFARICNREGEYTEELLVATEREVVREPAHMNLHYGELEVD